MKPYTTQPSWKKLVRIVMILYLNQWYGVVKSYENYSIVCVIAGNTSYTAYENQTRPIFHCVIIRGRGFWYWTWAYTYIRTHDDDYTSLSIKHGWQVVFGARMHVKLVSRGTLLNRAIFMWSTNNFTLLQVELTQARKF